MTATTPEEREPLDMPAAYEPADVEERIYGEWEQAGHFRPTGGEHSFTVIMPPPNLTGEGICPPSLSR